ncbi:MAG: Tat (twin-arginine translocation) pathway signal sequence containing protein [Sphingobacterium sp.]|jgi:rubrerythrin|uniref:ferritin-like domain-containing protein n=1 Tax=unclassified Sphingobacterium TaxID=2609468 RepID=UPI00098523A5|nr:ferritin-like domain-containing protein [Sphingobacterium sp. CZ-UAM]MDF2515684.1 Tat (twin-arginine translocation) pathway signal sequence containing protein [Sphingobacterium sp.]OOG17879.1 Tat (twin-arginine translocation) pathway signal sequence containing protein [Sphingobacterium sp. CZ-UAM]
MKKITSKTALTSISDSEIEKKDFRRRDFLKLTGASIASIAILGMTSCKKDHDNDMDNSGKGMYFGSGDIAILNYAYALEQLEAAFYIHLVNNPYSGISEMEKAFFTDLRDHEIAHREFFKMALGAKAISSLEFNLSGINFSSRASVLATAKTFEDLGVSAYNGAGWLIKDPNYLLLAGKIVSVEARHAAWVRDMIDNGSFANQEVVDSNGLDLAKSPSVVLSAAAPFIKSKIDVKDLPTY